VPAAVNHGAIPRQGGTKVAAPVPIVLVPGLLTSPGLGAIDRPTLVLVGDSDQLTPPELSAEIAGSIPGARLVVVAGAGHLTTLDQPEQVTWALVAWLQA
jgi:pimeloyl-ACP methyl ester carboxylesterase